MIELLLGAPRGGAMREGLFTEYMWLVPLLPFLSCAAIAFFGKRTKAKGHTFGIFAVAFAFALSLVGFVDLASGAKSVEQSWTWFQLGNPIESPLAEQAHGAPAGHGEEGAHAEEGLHGEGEEGEPEGTAAAEEESGQLGGEPGKGLRFEFGINYDFFTGIMFIVVTGISLMVHVYSTGYMHGDKRYTWFFSVLSLFTGSMLFMVASSGLMQLFVGWELVGVCSYFLIGHYWEEKENSSAAIKAFITTRVGDVGMLFGIFALFLLAGTMNIGELNLLAEEGLIGGVGLIIAALLLFTGPVGKSAQFPLHVWLPDAMAGPTPVSALIHAATMVVAGIYLVGRMLPVFEAAGVALDVVAVVASITMFIAALLATLQDDIKKVLAYSTVSQLGYMMAALGVGAFTAGIFHLFTHAVFKALLFLGAGSLIHAVHSNNMSDMGGMRRFMPHTYRTFIIGSAALAGIFPLAGFWSKDEILSSSLRAGVEGHWSAWIVFVTAMVTAFLTALYMTRACIKTFFGEYRGHGHPHESPGSMVTPLWILGSLSLVVGFLGIPVIGPFADWITLPGEEHHGFSLAYNVMLPVATLLFAGAAVYLGYLMFYRERVRIDVIGGPFGWLYRFVENKYYLDDIYLNGIVRPVQYPLARLAYWTNQHILDGIVDGSARLTLGSAGFTYNQIDQGTVDFMVNGAAGLTGWSGNLLKYIQTGNIQRYAAVLFGAVAVFVALFALT